MDADQRRGEGDRLAPAADLDAARAPGIRAREVVDDDRRTSRAGDVTELLRALELVAADVDRVAHGVVDPRDGDDVRRAVGPHGREPAELPPAAQIGQFGCPEDAHRGLVWTASKPTLAPRAASTSCATAS